MTNIVIVSHEARRDMTQRLADKVMADQIFEDDGTLGCEANHQRAWQWHAENTEDWAVVLEDDAVPVIAFQEQLEQALAVAPAPIVSLYLGTSYPQTWQPRIRHAINNIGAANWLIANTTLHAVGLAIRADLLPIPIARGLAVDAAIGNWAKRQGHHVAYAYPSLVDHADTPTLVTTRHSSCASRTEPRKAWHTGTRKRWTSRCKPL